MIRALHVTARPTDLELVRSALDRETGQIEFEQVDTLALACERLEASAGAAHDVVLVDLALRCGDATKLFAHVRSRGWPVALIALAEPGCDRKAVLAALKAGADDYVVMQADERARLPRVLRGALARIRRAEAVHRRPIRVLYLAADAQALAGDIARLAQLAPFLRFEVTDTVAGIAPRFAATPSGARFDVLVLERESNAADVLDVVKDVRESLSFDPATVLVAQVHDEDFALAALHLGVSEYLLKTPGYLEQLPALIEQAHARAQLAQLDAELERRVSERTSEQRKVIGELESFAHSAAHDLQAPARAIGGFAGVLAAQLGAAASPETAHILRRIERNARVMQQLIGDILDLARAGNAPLERTFTNLTALARECIDVIDDEAAATIDVAELGHGLVDRGLFRQVFSNLLDNAVKFTRGRNAPRIELGRQERAGESIWFVRDNGVGFDMSQAGRAFQMFQRLHRRDEFEGSGIGLAIVARVIERHGGRIWTNAVLGQGATFYFTIGC
jgi:signal transduction histidine kinase